MNFYSRFDHIKRTNTGRKAITCKENYVQKMHLCNDVYQNKKKEYGGTTISNQCEFETVILIHQSLFCSLTIESQILLSIQINTFLQTKANY